MKTRTKALLLFLGAILLVVCTVFGTLAYLTSTDEVINSFTVGKVKITLDEAKVDEYGVAEVPEVRVKANSYKLIPGHEYTKDPTVTVVAQSEACYVYVKVVNGISAYEDDANTIAAQIAAKGWAALDGVANVFYKSVDAESAKTGTTLDVFDGFEIATDADWSALTEEQIAQLKVSVTAYAVQTDGFGDAKAAWDATFGVPTP